MTKPNKPDIEYPKVVYATFSDYEAVKEGEEESRAGLLLTCDTAEEAEENADLDGEWIAVYRLVEMVKVKKTATIAERYRIS